MNKNSFQILCLSIILAGGLVIWSGAKSAAETPAKTPMVFPKSFPGVAVFVTPSGRVGFFEQGTGRIFIYDADFKECVFTARLKELGKPIEADQKDPGKTNGFMTY